MSDTPLPPLYADWITGILLEAPPPEPRSTCATCAMCVSPQGEIPAATYPFDPAVKCCTYTPVLPNFLVGRALRDPDPDLEHGRRTLRERIARGAAVTPLGLGRPPSVDALHKASLNADGRARAMLCPHYVSESGTCGIWRHRNGVCATWFCKHERGTVGRQFWATVREWLTAVEYTLARWCLLELGVDVGRLPATLVRGGEPDVPVLDAAAMDGHPDPSYQQLLWGDWYGREEAFYLACAEKVDGLGWEDVQRIGGPDVALFARVVAQAWGRLHDEGIPARLQLGQMQVLAVGPDGAIVVTDSPFDPVGVPALLLTALHYFDGRPTEAAFRALAEERGLSLDDRLLRAMLDYRVLVGAGDPGLPAMGREEPGPG